MFAEVFCNYAIDYAFGEDIFININNSSCNKKWRSELTDRGKEIFRKCVAGLEVLESIDLTQ